MIPETLLSTIKAGFEFGIELLRFLQSTQGQALLKKSLEDRESWDKWWSDRAKDIGKAWNSLTLIGK